MRPKLPKAEPQDDLFRARLENLVDPRHALVRLAGLIDWGRFEAKFGALYTDGGPTANVHLMQRQADLLGAAVLRSQNPELSALGVAHLAGLGAGLWDWPTLRALPRERQTFRPPT